MRGELLSRTKMRSLEKEMPLLIKPDFLTNRVTYQGNQRLYFVDEINTRKTSVAGAFRVGQFHLTSQNLTGPPHRIVPNL